MELQLRTARKMDQMDVKHLYPNWLNSTTWCSVERVCTSGAMIDHDVTDDNQSRAGKFSARSAQGQRKQAMDVLPAVIATPCG